MNSVGQTGRRDGSALTAEFHDLFARLGRVEPGSQPAEKRRAELAHRLMRIVLTKGLPGVRQLIRSLNSRAPLVPVFATGSVRAWRHATAGKVIELQTNTSRAVKSASVSYSKRPTVDSGRKQQARRRLQDRFYARYQQVGPAGREGRLAGLSVADRLVRSIGDLEADLNNGGFGQYLDNKGRSQAVQVLRQLQHVGADRTARLLGSALALPADSPQLDRLDGAFCRHPEDLASLVMRSLKKGHR